jgi:hypothetical protein
MRPYQNRKAKGTRRRAYSIIGFSKPEDWWKMRLEYQARNFKFIKGLHSLPENAHIIFATCILHNYLRDQGVGLRDMGSSANFRSNCTKIPNQGRRTHQSAFELRDTFEQYFNSPSESVPWQNERV